MAGFEEHAVMSFITGNGNMCSTHILRKPKWRYWISLSFFLPNAHHFPSLFRFAKKWRGSDERWENGVGWISRELPHSVLNCEFLYIAKIIVTANCQTFVWQILQPRHYLLQLIQLCALSLKKTPKLFAIFSHIIYRTKLPYAWHRQ